MSQLPADVVASFLERCRSEWSTAGLPGQITDPATLDRIASIVAAPTATNESTQNA